METQRVGVPRVGVARVCVFFSLDPQWKRGCLSKSAVQDDRRHSFFFIFSHIGSSLQWVDNIKQRIRKAKRYLKADYKLHVLEESPCYWRKDVTTVLYVVISDF